MFGQVQSDVNRLKDIAYYQNVLKKLEMLDKQTGELTVAEKSCRNRSCQSNELALSEMKLAMSRLLRQAACSDSNDFENTPKLYPTEMNNFISEAVTSNNCSPKRYKMEISSSSPDVITNNNNKGFQSTLVQPDMYGLAPQYKSPLGSLQSVHEEVLATLRLNIHLPLIGSAETILDPTNICTGRYKTELCRTFSETGRCNYNDKCQFAHGEHEMRPLPHHPKYKTELCRTFHTVGLCQYGPRCHFVHRTSAATGVGLTMKSRRDSTGEEGTIFGWSSSSTFTSPVNSPNASSKYVQQNGEGINMEAFSDALAWFSRTKQF